MFIASPHNDIIKLTVSLKQKKNRDELSLFVVEGFKQVSEIPENYKIKFLISTEKYKDFNTGGNKNHIVTEQLFKKISDTKTPQGILAIVEKPKYDIEKVLSQKGIFIVCDSLQDPGNLGTVIRTAEAFSCRGIFMSENSVDVYGDKVVRSSMGALFNIPVFQDCDIVSLIKTFKQKNIKTCALMLDTETVLSKYSVEQSVAVIVGNEANGIRKEIADISDDKVKIEMTGKSQSLNAAVACSIAVYELSKNTSK